ncbi:peroxisome biogenesis protein 22-like isoform X3 [Cynara cardunculus var. scolymus]|uniref:peroxisome biogenesis protein 22-like isoform X3 n=1 Tax=Cynara cardunculus var. scolymus TaxID=59895 RepID=UPI000D628C50|nr:peroxisome biogenesis protein 22-like isoform X3 [Cynara cardunculus var. scolymus]
MADSSKNDLLHLIKRIGAYLSTKVSKFLNIQDLRSFWAIAGLAVAVIYTWRVLRTSNGSRSKQPKRPAPAPSTSGFNTHPNENVLPSGVGSSSKDSRAQSAIDEFFQPANPTLGQIVRQKLGDGRKVTCRLLGVILEENTPEELQKKVLTALENAGVFTSGDLVKDKVLFCSTEKGRMSFVRQLEPDWHIDSNPEITSQLARFIKHQLHIKTEPERIASNVFTSSSLEQFFGV